MNKIQLNEKQKEQIKGLIRNDIEWKKQYIPDGQSFIDHFDIDTRTYSIYNIITEGTDAYTRELFNNVYELDNNGELYQYIVNEYINILKEYF